MPRPRSGRKIREDAIKMGVKKAQSGCLDCMEGYFNLAKEHGATEVDIRVALERVTTTRGRGLSRRELIKLAVASGVALSASAAIVSQAKASTTYYWGTDSLTATCCGMPANFYIGRFGHADEQNGDSTYFN